MSITYAKIQIIDATFLNFTWFFILIIKKLKNYLNKHQYFLKKLKLLLITFFILILN